MIVVNFRELLTKKERNESRKITLEEMAEVSGVSRFILGRLAGYRCYYVSTDVLDKLCRYFDCREIGEIVQYSPDEHRSSKALKFHDIKQDRRGLAGKIVEYLTQRLPELGIVPAGCSVYSHYKGDPGYDFMIEDDKKNRIIVEFRPQLFGENDRKIIDSLLESQPEQLLVITMSNRIPRPLRQIYDPRVQFYYAEILFDEINQKIIDCKLERL